MIRNLRKRVKVKDEDRVKLEEVLDHANEGFESKQHLNDNESKNLQSDIKEGEPIENVVPAETISVENVVPTEKISDEKEDIEVQRQSPITVLLEDEKWLFEDDKVPVTDATRVCTKQEFHSHGDEVILSKRKKLKAVEFASVIYQGKTFKMLGEIAPVWRPRNQTQK